MALLYQWMLLVLAAVTFGSVIAAVDVIALRDVPAENLTGEYRPLCPKVACPYDCPNGYQVGANGCQTCQCICPAIKCAPCQPPQTAQTITDPETGCPTGCACECPLKQELCISCPYGYYPPDSSICPGCPKCKPKPICPTVKCSYDCPNGYLEDANGCRTCRCRCPAVKCAVCPPPLISLPIINSTTKCITGCSCRCPMIGCATCPIPLISVPIINLATNCTTGCSCKCPPPPPCAACLYGSDAAQEAPCPTCPVCRPRPTCPASNCETISCPGNSVITVTNSNGCSQCRCRCPPLSPCPACLYGSDAVQGAICPMCPVCRPRPTCPVSNCEAISCPGKSIITLTDSNGCSQCRCRCPIVDCAACPIPQKSVPIVDPATNCTTGCSCECPILSCPLCPYDALRAAASVVGDCPVCPPCKSPPICPDIVCTNRCPKTFLNDVNGCPTCNCPSPTVV